MHTAFTARQGQYLAFIYYYDKINRRTPAEADIQKYFKVSPPTVHQMILTLEAGGYIERTPGLARSIRVLVPPNELPNLEWNLPKYASLTAIACLVMWSITSHRVPKHQFHPSLSW